MTRAAFEENLTRKLENGLFRADITGLLRPSVAWDIEGAAAFVMERLLARLPGDPWERPVRDQPRA